MAQLVQCLPRMQNVAGLSPARGSSSFSQGKEELSLGVVACICSITDYSCTCMVHGAYCAHVQCTCYLYIHVQYILVTCIACA